MADIDLKTETPDTTLPTTGFLFGADSQAAASPSVYSTQTVATTLLGPTTPFNASITADAPVLNLAQTWNASGVTFTGLRFNAATGSNAGSAAASLLMDLQLEGTSRFNVSKTGVIKAPQQSGYVLGQGSGNDSGFGWTSHSPAFYRYNALIAQFALGASIGGPNAFNLGANAVSFGTDPAVVGDLFLTRRAAANLRLGAADTSASATITVTIAAPGVVTWSDHSLSTGSPVIFTTTGALPTGITANTTYYAIVVSANTFQLASSFANALAGTAITTSGTQSGTHTGRRGAIAQQFGVQDTLSTSSLENIDGADFVIRGSRSIGNKPGGSIIFQVAPAGSSGTAQNALATALTIDGTRNVTIDNASAVLQINRSGTTKIVSYVDGGNLNSVNLASDVGLSWNSTTTATGSFDLAIFRDTSNTLALRRGTNAQAFRVYNTYTSATDFERGNIFWDSNVLKIGTEKGSAGGTARVLEFQTDGVTRLTIAAAGSVSINGTTFATNSQVTFTQRVDFSSSHVAGWGSNSSYIFGNASTGGATGTMRIVGNTTTALNFGGDTSSFPALKRSSATLQVRLADDSGDADLSAKALTLSGNLTISTKDIVTDTTTGTKIGTGTTQKIGFYNNAPVVQPTAVADATDNATAITQLNALLSRMRDLGLIAT